jgi:hypothetical protein
MSPRRCSDIDGQPELLKDLVELGHGLTQELRLARWNQACSSLEEGATDLAIEPGLIQDSSGSPVIEDASDLLGESSPASLDLVEIETRDAQANQEVLELLFKPGPDDGFVDRNQVAFKKL